MLPRQTDIYLTSPCSHARVLLGIMYCRLLAAEGAAAGLPDGTFVMLQHGGIIRTADGIDSRRAPLLPVSNA